MKNKTALLKQFVNFYTACGDGHFGMECSEICGNCLSNDQHCDHINGHCTNGCASGFKGPVCKQTCPFGKYGDQCNSHCSGHCLNNNTCHHISGHCTNGCNAGYNRTDLFCNT
ncbi:MEG10-like protein, partial [Mya arenaria]